MFIFLQTSQIAEIGTIIGVVGGVVGTVIGVLATYKASQLKTQTAQLEIHAKTFEVETVAKQEIAKTEITATQTLLESWKEQSNGQAGRIDQIEAELKHCTENHNRCEVKCAKLEGKVEMLTSLQGVTIGKVNTQSERQDLQYQRQDLQEERQNTQEERQNFIETKTINDSKLTVEKVDIEAGIVEVKPVDGN
ncbi:MAG: hypothetical protein M3367_03070 [Acidobacteriota bacterium]|nr:hypothetical protein [Acidobacteriota bacterium]